MSCKWEKKAPTVFFLLSYATFAPCYLIKVVRVDSRSTITVQLPFFSFTALQQTQWWGRPFENAISNVMTTTIAIYKHHSYRNYCNRICHCSRLRKKKRDKRLILLYVLALFRGMCTWLFMLLCLLECHFFQLALPEILFDFAILSPKFAPPWIQLIPWFFL